MQHAQNGFNDFCVRNIELAGQGREEIKLAEKGLKNFAILSIPRGYALHANENQ